MFICTCITPSIAVDTIEQCTLPISNGKTLYVGGTGEGNYTKIQDAIDNASDGDTVYVYDDSSPYYENLKIDKSIILIGEDRDSTIIDGSGVGDVVYISADWVNISGFTIKYGFLHGIEINSNYNTFTGNTISNNHHDGIYLLVSNSNTFTGNDISNNGDGIELQNSNSNIISSNTISNNGDGINLDNSNNNNIKGNNIISNKYYGISLHGSKNTFTGNIISNNGDGILLLSSKFTTIKGNNISNNDDGIYLGNSGYNFILKNNFLNNEQDAYFTCLLYLNRNLWMLNYWNEPRILPKLIKGRLSLPNHISWIPQIDWRPALKPYNIEGVI